MNLNEIGDVRELTQKECEEISGGGVWTTILKKLLRAIAGEIAISSLHQAVSAFFS